MTAIANNINDILGKIHELRAVFVLGQRAVPFLEEIFVFLKEISPLLDEINASIRDSTAKMPHATSQLQSVSAATELATTEILDLIDAVMATVGEHRRLAAEATQRTAALREADTRLLAVLEAALAGQDDAFLEQIRGVQQSKAAHYDALEAGFRDKPADLDEVRNKLNRITLSLQVQDITTQQLAAVNHLILSIQKRMDRLIDRLGNQIDANPIEQFAEIANPGTFDPNARFETRRNKKHQSVADNVVASFNQEAASPEHVETGDGAAFASQDDIDQMFGGAAPAATPASQDDIDQMFSGGAPAGPASQDDIDQMFGATAPAAAPASQDNIDQMFSGGAPAGPASQDDIDQMFGATTPPTAPAAPGSSVSQDDIDQLFGS